MQETVEIEKLRELVISRLKKIEREGSIFWWEDRKLFQAFDQLFTSGVILLPLNIVERVRWIALVCVEICRIEGFPYSDILFSADYVPDEGLNELQYSFGDQVVENVMSFRKELAQRSWKSMI